MGTPGKAVLLPSGKRGLLPSGKAALFDIDGKCVACCGCKLQLSICVDRLVTVTFGTGADNNKFRLEAGGYGGPSEYLSGFPNGCNRYVDPTCTFLVDGVVWRSTWYTAPGVVWPVGTWAWYGFTDWYTMGGGKTFTPGSNLTATKGPGSGYGTVTCDGNAGTIVIDDEPYGGQYPYDLCINW